MTDLFPPLPDEPVPLPPRTRLDAHAFDAAPTLAQVVDAQATPPALPGPHYVGPFDEGTVNNVYWPNIRKCQYLWVTILGAAQYDQARDFARNVQVDPIRTNVVFRHWKGVQGSPSDNGRMSVLNAHEWIERVGSQHIHAPYWIMPDNEGLGATVVNNSAALVPLASSLKLKLALGAWSSHVEPERRDDKGRPEWPTYLPLYAAMYDHPEHIAAPHIYYSKGPRSVENLDGFKYLVELFAYVERMMTAPIPFEVVITEYGRLSNRQGTGLDPDGGYQLEDIGETDYADEMLTLAAPYRKWSFNPFSRGAWGTRGSLGVGKDYEARMEQYASGELPMPEAPISPPEVVVKLRNGATSLKLRSARTPASTDLGDIRTGDTVGYELPTQAGVVVQGNDQWLHVYKPALARGAWVSAHYIEVPDLTIPEPEPEEPVPPKEPPVDPPPPPPVVYITVTEAQALVDAKAEATMNFMKEWVLSVLTEIAKADNAALLKRMELLSPPDTSKQEFPIAS